MHVFLSVLGWLLLALLCILVLALVLPVCVDLEYKNAKFSATLRVLFRWSIKLYPFPEKANQPEPPEKEEKNESDAKKKPAKPKKSMPRITLEMVWGLVSTSGAAMRIVLRGLWVTHIRVVWPVHDEDPAQTAIAYGQTQAYFGGVVAALRNFLWLRKFEQVDILADYDNKFSESTYLYCTIGTTPAIMVTAGIYALVRIFKEHLLSV